MTATKQPQYLTMTQVAEMFEVNRTSVHDWIVAGKFPGAFRVPGGAHTPWLIPVEDVEKYKKERDQSGN